MKFLLCFLMTMLLFPCLAGAKAKKIDDYHWSGVDRVIAIGDLHGDYERYIEVMRSAGLLNRRGKWAGGKTHLVQTGDITDRGADSRKIIDHLRGLAKQAKRKGGYVHTLIGNHETMNVSGDLRYVHAGEFQAFETPQSSQYREMQWKRQVDWMRTIDPEAFELLDLVSFRKDWEQRVPLGWVEHRQAWGLGGEYGKWVNANPVAIRVNDTLFLHGGISAKYCQFSLQSLSEQVGEALANYDPAVPSIITDGLGPVWYRGLALEEEADVFSQTLDNILKRYSAKRIVIGHTPTGGVVWPRFDQRVVANDSGIATYYGSHKGVLELTADGAVAIYGNQRLDLPTKSAEREDYLRAVIELDSNNALLKQKLAQMLAPPVEPAVTEESVATPQPDSALVVEEPIPGTCQ